MAFASSSASGGWCADSRTVRRRPTLSARDRASSARLISADTGSPRRADVTPAEQPVGTVAHRRSARARASCSVVAGARTANRSTSYRARMSLGPSWLLHDWAICCEPIPAREIAVSVSTRADSVHVQQNQARVGAREHGAAGGQPEFALESGAVQQPGHLIELRFRGHPTHERDDDPDRHHRAGDHQPVPPLTVGP